MTAQQPPAWLQAGSHPADLDRRLLESMSTPGVVSLDTGALKVTEQAAPAMGVTVAAGKAFVDGTESSAQGVYHVVNDAPVDLAVAASDPTNPRKDLVVAVVRDSFYSGAADEWALEVVTGTAAASPSEPSVPANALVLALVDVPAAASSIVNANVTDRRTASYTRGQFVQRVVFTSSGSFVKANYPWLGRVVAHVIGGGGGSGGTGAAAAGTAAVASGGGGGGYATKVIAASSLAASETVTVGAGGTAGASGGGNGGDGGNSSFAGLSATGGIGGTGFGAGSSSDTHWIYEATGGVGSGGDINLYGEPSGRGAWQNDDVFSLGFGGAAAGPYGGTPSRDWSNGFQGSPGADGRPFGGGAAGAISRSGGPARVGGAGAAGAVILDLYA